MWFVQGSRHYLRYVMMYELCGCYSSLGIRVQDEPRAPVNDRGVLSRGLKLWWRRYAGWDGGRRSERGHFRHEWSWGVPTLECWSNRHGGCGGRGWRRHGGGSGGGVEESGGGEGGGGCGLLELEFWVQVGALERRCGRGRERQGQLGNVHVAQWGDERGRWHGG